MAGVEERMMQNKFSLCAQFLGPSIGNLLPVPVDNSD